MAKATVSISEGTHAIKIEVPRGTKWPEVGKIIELCTTAILRPPSICQTCLTGRVLQIVEELPEITRVELD